ncbi:hypothetical protein T05_6027 [Trichinella murrelli]|uniref:Uncharacterized protein n=1 Tax=Trichinella murrelli TaxID=144512 RepID=A0A0V0UC16_9BILA|nr:hypothetical protein T05_6027 [Trichinella murrelli]
MLEFFENHSLLVFHENGRCLTFRQRCYEDNPSSKGQLPLCSSLKKALSLLIASTLKPQRFTRDSSVFVKRQTITIQLIMLISSV